MVGLKLTRVPTLPDGVGHRILTWSSTPRGVLYWTDAIRILPRPGLDPGRSFVEWRPRLSSDSMPVQTVKGALSGAFAMMFERPFELCMGFVEQESWRTVSITSPLLERSIPFAVSRTGLATALLHDGSRLWIAMRSGESIELPPLPGNSRPSSLAFQGDDRLFLGFEGPDRRYHISVLRTPWKEVQEVHSSDNDMKVISGADGKVYVMIEIEEEAQHEVGVLEGVENRFTPLFSVSSEEADSKVFVSPSGRWLAFHSPEEEFGISLRARDGELVSQVEHPESFCGPLLWSPDELEFAFWSQSGVGVATIEEL